MEHKYLKKWLKILNVKTLDYIDFEYNDIRFCFSPNFVLSQTFINKYYNHNTTIIVYDKLTNTKIKEYDSYFIGNLDETHINKQDIALRSSGQLTEKLICLIFIKIISDYFIITENFKKHQFLNGLRDQIKNNHMLNLINSNSELDMLNKIEIYKWHRKSGKRIVRRPGEEDLYNIEESEEFYFRFQSVFILNPYIESLLPKKTNSNYTEYNWNSECAKIPTDELLLDYSTTEDVRKKINLSEFYESFKNQ